jgi:hypothetical protein
MKRNYCACDSEFDCAINHWCGHKSPKNTFYLGDNPQNDLVKCRLRHKAKKEILAAPLQKSEVENFKTFKAFEQLNK